MPLYQHRPGGVVCLPLSAGELCKTSAFSPFPLSSHSPPARASSLAEDVKRERRGSERGSNPEARATYSNDRVSIDLHPNFI